MREKYRKFTIDLWNNCKHYLCFWSAPPPDTMPYRLILNHVCQDGILFPISCISLSLDLPTSRIIPIKYLLVFPTPSISYLGFQDLWWVSASCGEGIGDVFSLCLGGGEIGGDWLGRSGEGREGGWTLSVVGEGGDPGYDLPFIITQI